MLSQIQPNPGMVAPFVALLAAIALAPLFFADWWSRHFLKVILALSAITVVYYLAGLHAQERVLHTAAEYLSFICLVGSLFVVSGGIHINIKGEASPAVNVLFLLIGALVANVLGTTGASMLLIRPWLRMNSTGSLRIMSFSSSSSSRTSAAVSRRSAIRRSFWDTSKACRFGGWRSNAGSFG